MQVRERRTVSAVPATRVPLRCTLPSSPDVCTLCIRDSGCPNPLSGLTRSTLLPVQTALQMRRASARLVSRLTQHNGSTIDSLQSLRRISRDGGREFGFVSCRCGSASFFPQEIRGKNPLYSYYLSVPIGRPQLGCQEWRGWA